MGSVDPDRPMATITTIISKTSIPWTNKLEIVGVYGWNVVVEKDLYNVGDLCIYIVNDSVIPTSLNIPIKIVKSRLIKDIYSDGIILPLSKLKDIKNFQEDLYDNRLIVEKDLTNIIGIKKWVSNDEISQYINNKVNLAFPLFIPKTDEIRLQSNINIINKFLNNKIYITRKEDGCSGTYIWKDNKFYICSRNYELLEEDNGNKMYYICNIKYDIKNKLEDYCKNNSCNIGIQGEIVGPKINGNKLLLTEIEFRIFSIYNINENKYFSTSKMIEICKELNFTHVPILYHGICDNKFNNVKKFIDFADSIEYSTNVPAEGIVVRLDSDLNKTSFKIISNKYK